MSVASCPFVMSGKAAKTAKSHVDEVSMMIGTDGSHETEYGGTTPAVGSPFAMTQCARRPAPTVYPIRCIAVAIRS